ncbi:MAG: hypothetical protein JWO78_108 [Micavibrio sp.]|nr:hypothetical protein [Micavibrio sp.]
MSLRTLATVFGLAGATALGGCAVGVSPHGHVSVGVAVPPVYVEPVYTAPVYTRPAPYYAPPPRYYNPPVVVVPVPRHHYAPRHPGYWR